MLNFLLVADTAVNVYFKSIDSTFLTSVSYFIDFLFEAKTVFWVSLVLLVFFVLYKKWKDLIMYAFTVGGGTFLGYVLKYIIHRSRPTNDFLSLGDFAFPSGHSLVAFLICGFIFLFVLKSKSDFLFKTSLTVFIFLVPVLVGASRLILGVHWLTDVLGAFVLGVLWLFLAKILEPVMLGLINKFEKRSF